MGSYLIVFSRSIGFFLGLLLLARLMGRKQISQLTFFDYIVGITIGSIAANLVTSNSVPILDGIIALTVWALMPIIIGYLTLENLKLRKIVDGEPLIIIKNGVVLDKNMRKAKYNMGDLQMQLRQKDIFDLSEIEFAILEPNGQLSVLKKSQHNPITPKDLNLPTSYKGLTTDLILNGQIIEPHLRAINLDTPWLLDQLRIRDINDLNKIIFAGIQTDGQLYIVLENNEKLLH